MTNNRRKKTSDAVAAVAEGRTMGTPSIATPAIPDAPVAEESEDRANFIAYLEYKKTGKTPKSPEPPAMLIHCKVARLFYDGNTTERFKALGYDVQWPAEQVRDITLDLFEACKISGARIEIVPEAE